MPKIGHSFYSEQGQGPPLLLLNGLGFSRWSWSWQWEQLPEVRLIALENRGLGGSDLGSEPFELADLADDAVRLLDHLGLEKAHIWGVSMGGMIAQELAVRHPERCAGLIVGCSMCGGRAAVHLSRETLDLMTRLAHDGVTPESVRGAERLNFSPDISPEVAEEYVRLRVAYQPPVETWNRQREAVSRYDVSQTISAYRGPVLLMHGGQDEVVPSANLAILQGLLPQAQVKQWPQAGHLFWIEHAQEVNQLVRQFVCGA